MSNNVEKCFKSKYPLPLKILGIGTALPKNNISSEELEERYNLEKGWCTKKQGIKKRYWISDEESNTSLGVRATKDAIKNAKITIEDIDLIINASNTYDSMIPDQSVLLKKAFDMKKKVPFLTINAGCLNYIHSLDIASNLLASNKYKNILIVTTVIASKGFINGDNSLVATMLADAAAATVVTKTPKNQKSCLKSVFTQTFGIDSEVSGLQGDRLNKIIFSKDVKREDIYFNFDSKMMQMAGAKYNQEFIHRLLTGDRRSVDWLIPNQSTRLAVDMMKLMFSKEKVLSVVESYGNIGSVGYPIALHHAIEDGRIKRGDTILMNGIGAGISLAGLILTY